MTVTASDLQEILASHAKWRAGNVGGSRADLRDANLRDANLSYANLSGADLSNANLSDADLRNADLSGANLSYANLSYADLRYANMRDANLRDANLSYADLSYTDLRGANMRDANLRDADLRDANLSGADLSDFEIPQEGSLIAWKAVAGGIAKIEVPAEAKRTACLINRTCRAEFVRVLEILADTGESLAEAPGRYDASTIYRVGEVTHPDSYDDTPAVDCTHGIHFFLTRREAEKW